VPKSINTIPKKAERGIRNTLQKRRKQKATENLKNHIRRREEEDDEGERDQQGKHKHKYRINLPPKR
jgi:hypothetical protein